MAASLSQAARVAEAEPPEIHLEARQGAGAGTRYPLPPGGFLVGSVPGCDLRVPGKELPALLCLICRHGDGAFFRKLAPTQAILINGKSARNGPLQDGDRVTVGPVDLFVRIPPAARSTEIEEGREYLETRAQQFRDEVARFQKEREQSARQSQEQQQAFETRRAELEAYHRQLQEQTQELEAERV